MRGERQGEWKRERGGGLISHITGSNASLTCTAFRLSLMCMRSASSGTLSSDFRYCISPSGCSRTQTVTVHVYMYTAN